MVVSSHHVICLKLGPTVDCLAAFLVCLPCVMNWVVAWATSHQDHRAVLVRWIDSIWFIINHSSGDHILGTRIWSQTMCLLARILQCCSCFHKCMKIPYAYSITVTVCCIIIAPKLCAPVCIINRDCHNTICTVDEHLIIMKFKSLATSFDRYRD